jgi:peptide methionine sulfoxide reductase MsrB/flagellar basal body-associated protein FliL
MDRKQSKTKQYCSRTSHKQHPTTKGKRFCLDTDTTDTDTFGFAETTTEIEKETMLKLKWKFFLAIIDIAIVIAAVAIASTVTFADAAADETVTTEIPQCMGKDPMASVATFMNMELDYDLADRICCHNHHFAEPRRYHEWPEVNFYSKLDPSTETVFYDSVCGIPLFVAPRGRSFDEFVAESLHHGWPSFRPAEMVSENVIIHEGGRMESRCGTHLGHNLPNDGIDRYCIDLVCMAGMPLNVNSNDTEAFDFDFGFEFDTIATTNNDQGILSASEFDAANYESSAAENSGKHPKTRRNILVAMGILLALLLIGVVVVVVVVGKRRTLCGRGSSDPSSEAKKTPQSDPEQPQPQQHKEESEQASTDGGTNSDHVGSRSSSS